MTKFGSNEFRGVPVPLVIGRRYFILHGETPPLLSILYDDPKRGPLWEVRYNKPAENASATAAGIVTITNPASGQMLYKVRPGSETSVVFGAVKDGEVNVKITDRFIDVNTNRFERNTVVGSGAGIVVSEDGRQISMGAPVPGRVIAAMVEAQRNED